MILWNYCSPTSPMVIFLSDTVRPGQVEVISIIDRLRMKKAFNREFAQHWQQMSVFGFQTVIFVSTEI